MEWRTGLLIATGVFLVGAIAVNPSIIFYTYTSGRMLLERIFPNRVPPIEEEPKHNLVFPKLETSSEARKLLQTHADLHYKGEAIDWLKLVDHLKFEHGLPDDTKKFVFDNEGEELVIKV